MQPWPHFGMERVLTGWDAALPRAGPPVLGVLAGEGVGPEVVGAALDVLAAVEEAHGPGLQVRRVDVDLPASRAAGEPLPPQVADLCASVFAAGGAVLCGPGGGRFVYELRRRFDLFCKLTPVQPLACVGGTGVLRPEAVADVDILFVRDNTGGLYFAESRERRAGGRVAEVHCRFGYGRDHVDRLLDVAARLARSRRGRLSVVIKGAGVPALGELWRASAEAAGRRAGVTVEMLDVDNACYQVVARARSFDVVAAPNMFGDVIADVATLLLGSRGLAYSANFGDRRVAIYQTAHGSAHDIAGTDRADPVAQILSLAWMLHEHHGRAASASLVRRAVEATLSDGWRTPDIAAPGCTVVGTRELGRRIADAVVALASGRGRPDRAAAGVPRPATSPTGHAPTERGAAGHAAAV